MLMSYARRRLLILLAIVTSLVAVAAPPRAQAVQYPSWAAWGLTIDFPNNQLRAIYTLYVGTNSPKPAVLDQHRRNISASCTNYGVTVKNERANFDGKSYIKCRLPRWRVDDPALALNFEDENVQCSCGENGSQTGPFFVAANVRLATPPISATLPISNPLFESRERGIAFSLPTDGVTATTRVQVSSGEYESPGWAVETSGNRMLMGMNGPAIRAVSNHFGWLAFLQNAGWKTYFSNKVVGPTMGHWVEPSAARWKTTATAFTLGTQAADAYIGYSPTTGKYFYGKLTDLQIDPACPPIHA